MSMGAKKNRQMEGQMKLCTSKNGTPNILKIIRPSNLRRKK